MTISALNVFDVLIAFFNQYLSTIQSSSKKHIKFGIVFFKFFKNLFLAFTIPLFFSFKKLILYFEILINLLFILRTLKFFELSIIIILILIDD